MIVGEEDDLGDEVALAGDGLAMVAEVPAEALEEGRALVASEAGHRARPRTSSRAAPAAGGCSSSMRRCASREQLGERLDRAAADLLDGGLELAPLLALHGQHVARGVDAAALAVHPGEDRGAPLAPFVPEGAEHPDRRRSPPGGICSATAAARRGQPEPGGHGEPCSHRST